MQAQMNLLLYAKPWKASMLSMVWNISYVLDTEDFFFRPRRNRRNSSRGILCRDEERVQRFHSFLSA
nr:paired amphipathic helix protein sin3-like 2 [Quercus suber]